MSIDKEHHFDPAEDEAILDDWLRIVPEGTAQAVRLYPRQVLPDKTVWLLGELPGDGSPTGVVRRLPVVVVGGASVSTG